MFDNILQPVDKQLNWIHGHFELCKKCVFNKYIYFITIMHCICNSSSNL